MSRRKVEIVYRTGTEECPSFDVQHNPDEGTLLNSDREEDLNDVSKIAFSFTTVTSVGYIPRSVRMS